jgi:hypothetical protein
MPGISSFLLCTMAWIGSQFKSPKEPFIYYQFSYMISAFSNMNFPYLLFRVSSFIFLAEHLTPITVVPIDDCVIKPHQFTVILCLHSDVQDVKEQNSTTISPMQQQKKANDSISIYIQTYSKLGCN